MYLKIMQDNWAGFTGDFGGVQFLNGVSVTPVTPIIARRLAAIVSMETLEGDNPNPGQVYNDNGDTPADPNAPVPDFTQLDQSQAIHMDEAPPPAPWTKEELEAIAEAQGIQGLRDIADPLDIKANSIVKLIEMLLKSGAVPSKVE